MKIKEWKLKKTSCRRMLYLLAIVVICSLGLLCSNARIAFYKAYKASEKKFLSTHLEQDTEAAQYDFYANYRPNTNYIEVANAVGRNAIFINVCQTSCALFKGNDVVELCSDLYSNDKFNEYRVYHCSVKVTLENDQPLKCEAINWSTFKASCNLKIAKT